MIETLFPRCMQRQARTLGSDWSTNERGAQERVTFVTLIYVLLSPKSSLAVLNLMKNPIFFYVEIYRGSHISEVMSERFVRIVRNRRIDFLQCKKYARRLCLQISLLQIDIFLKFPQKPKKTQGTHNPSYVNFKEHLPTFF